MIRNKLSLQVIVITMSPILSAQTVLTGKELYQQSCQVCHGEDGEATMPGVKDLSGINGTLLQDDQQLAKLIREGVQQEGATVVMPPLGGNPQLTDKDVQKIILYMRKKF